MLKRNLYLVKDVRFDFVMAITMMFSLFCDVTPCNLVEMNGKVVNTKQLQHSTP